MPLGCAHCCRSGGSARRHCVVRVLCALWGLVAVAARCLCKVLRRVLLSGGCCVCFAAWVLMPLQQSVAARWVVCGCWCRCRVRLQGAAVRVLCVLWGLRLLECSVRLDLRYWCRRSSAAAGGKVLLQAVARCCCHSAACAVELARLCCGGCHCRVRTIRSRKSVWVLPRIPSLFGAYACKIFRNFQISDGKNDLIYYTHCVCETPYFIRMLLH